jgi:histidine triad (HIT) family protein
MKKKFIIALALIAATGIIFGLFHENIQNALSAKSDCPFCKIVANDTQNQIIKEGADVMAIKKNRQTSRVDFLIIPKEHIINLKNCDPKKAGELFGKMMTIVQELARKSQQTGEFTLMINNGQASGQSVFHWHMHVKSPDSSWGF